MLEFKLMRVLAVAAALSVCLLPAAADAESTPNGPWVTPEQNISLEAFSDYEQLTERLMQIEAASSGLVAHLSSTNIRAPPDIRRERM